MTVCSNMHPMSVINIVAIGQYFDTHGKRFANGEGFHRVALHLACTKHRDKNKLRL